MNNHSLLGPWVRRFLTEHLVSERNYSVNTQRSYRDTLVLLIPFLTRALRKMPDGLAVLDLTEERIKSFLVHLEESRHCRIRTRNQRLSAIRSLAHFVGMHSPEHIDWSGQIRSIPIKKSMRGQVSYLEKPEMNALLETPDSKTKLGLRDHTILLFLYNSGARADEVAQLTIADLNLAPKPQNGLSSVRLLGKGRKVRLCPLWPKTASALAPLVAGRPASERVFLNRCGQPFTRFGVHALVKRHAIQAKENMPSLAKKQLSPHTLRHTTATHLWRGGVDINTIRDWLGHVSVDTTNIYAETGLEMKAQALARCGVDTVSKRRRKWKEDAEVMAFLRAL
jgi:site-specific recombinase XerD